MTHAHHDPESRSLSRLEQHAIALLRRGLDVQRVADLTTINMRRIHQLARGGACELPWCGKPQDGPGHPRRGSIRVHQAGAPGGKQSALWFCGWPCVLEHAEQRAAA